jgi:NADH:ubiquinone oxidoreductase subunit E
MDNYALLNEFIDALPEKKGALISVLHKAQDLFGYLPPEVQDHVAEKLNIPAAKVYGVVTFYSFFTMQKKGKFPINICMGTACFVKGAEAILSEFETATANNEDFSVDALRCIGACGLALVLTVNGKYYGRVTKADVKGILQECK